MKSGSAAGMLAVLLLPACGSEIAPSTATPSNPPVTPFAGRPDEAMALQLKRGVTVRVQKVERTESSEPSVNISQQGDEVMVLDGGGYNEKRTEGVVQLGEYGESNHMGTTASDLITTYHRTDIPEDMWDVVDEDLPSDTTRTIKIAEGIGESKEFVRPATTEHLPQGKIWYRDARDYDCAMKSGLGSFSISELIQVDLLKSLVTLAAPPATGEPLDGVDTTLLKHLSLLDAAHIIPDREERGVPAVSNGMALCKIHHAAYDQNILGVRPDLMIEVRSDILEEIDGPMLKHGLQEMHGLWLVVPHRKMDRPKPELIEERYERFRTAG
ncbi:hypothetical protein GCM10009555_015150 [Acrocarpospora macrocephala]|uniref:HNH nuclease domain-containing protein n=1 Tax=Acrocarpospora macrocephala TaxID=150177 RepID=A0A5M3X0G3_9ACTN|nr:HNH endonuclease [Acrocarpospora macrocephala]GES14156.1 hypothetical protein Amac_077530 [Acrocarpospora macrocephala]